jgi:hypothetical protein
MKSEPARKKICGTCLWYRETKAYTGVCIKYNIVTRMEGYRLSCKDWAPAESPPLSGDVP